MFRRVALRMICGGMLGTGRQHPPIETRAVTVGHRGTGDQWREITQAATHSQPGHRGDATLRPMLEQVIVHAFSDVLNQLTGNFEINVNFSILKEVIINQINLHFP